MLHKHRRQTTRLEHVQSKHIGLLDLLRHTNHTLLLPSRAFRAPCLCNSGASSRIIPSSLHAHHNRGLEGNGAGKWVGEWGGDKAAKKGWGEREEEGIGPVKPIVQSSLTMAHQFSPTSKSDSHFGSATAAGTYSYWAKSARAQRQCQAAPATSSMEPTQRMRAGEAAAYRHAGYSDPWVCPPSSPPPASASRASTFADTAATAAVCLSACIVKALGPYGTAWLESQRVRVLCERLGHDVGSLIDLAGAKDLVTFIEAWPSLFNAGILRTGRRCVRIRPDLAAPLIAAASGPAAEKVGAGRAAADTAAVNIGSTPTHGRQTTRLDGQCRAGC